MCFISKLYRLSKFPALWIIQLTVYVLSFIHKTTSSLSHSSFHQLPLCFCFSIHKKKMLLFLNESCRLSKQHCQNKASTEQELMHFVSAGRLQSQELLTLRERERHFLLVNAILNYYYFIWSQGKAHLFPAFSLLPKELGILNGGSDFFQQRALSLSMEREKVLVSL